MFDSKAGKFDLTILRATGLEQFNLPTSPPQFYVTVEIDDQVCKTKASEGAGQPAWNQRFTFTLKAISESNINISIYQTSAISRDVLLGSITEPLVDFEPRNQEVDKTITTTTNSLVTITLRVGEIVFSGPKSRVYALIIGIQRYCNPDIPPLFGCVNDAKTFKAFLTEYLHVPDAQIILLTNEAATRSKILSAFREHFTDNNEIDRDDAIIFFYAGHGSRMPAPVDWATIDGKIETISPYDYGMPDNNGLIYAIPDLTINVMFRDLAAKKGNNITAIFDTCHSGGIMRSTPNNTPLTVRFVETPPTLIIPSSLDREIWGSIRVRAADVDIPAPFQHKHMASHVLLAACRQDQLAHETTTTDGVPCGFFTHNLLTQLRLADLHRVTYADLLNLLPEMINQTPQCEGEHKDRFLFDGKAAIADPKAFMVVEAEGVIRVRAGSIHGVMVGTEFAIQDLNATSSSRSDLGILVALKVHVDDSILGHRPGDDKFDVPKGAKAVVSDWKNDAAIMKVAVELAQGDPLARALFPERDLAQPDQVQQILNCRFAKVHSRANADIVIKRCSADKEDLVIERLDSLIAKYANVTTKFNLAGRREYFPFIFDAIAQFHYQLARHPGDDPFDKLVSMELFKLRRGSESRWVPDEEVGNLLVHDDARLVADDHARYGLTIINQSEHDLFPYLFYFDPSDYSISDLFLPPAPKGAAPLPRGSNPTTVTVGFGADGGDPLVFKLNPGELSDTGFFKLFVFPRYVDMGWLRFPSAFQVLDRRGAMRRSDEIKIWGACIASVTVYKER